MMLKLRRSFSWKLLKSEKHPDFNLSSNIYEHEALGSKLVHLESGDPHKAFAVLFRTTPQDDTGAPHCLEHIALCGSQKYPVRDPFMKMLSRSLNSYMNAWTGCDFTMYPFSTQNHKDFSNLLGVYLDCAFFPLIKYHDYRQEAWRTEYNQENLEFKGVVFNEMKGVMSDPSNYLLHKLQNLAYQGSSYQYNSGGDPLAIPELTYEGLKEFHRKFYHPCNATFLAYGDMDPKHLMSQIEEGALNKFQKIDIDTSVKPTPRRDVPFETSIPVAQDAVSIDPLKNNKFAITYVCNDIAEDPYTTFCLGVLSHTLFEGLNSPMYKALLESGLGNSYIPGYGYDASIKDSSFTLGLNGVAEKDTKLIEKTILNTLQNCMSQGIDKQLIESAIHQIEIRHKQVKSNYGLMLISSMIPYALHGTDPLVPLYLNQYVDRLRSELQAGKPVLEDLIKKYLWDNPHKIIARAYPDEKFNENVEKVEKSTLEKIKENLSEEDKQKIIIEAQELAQAQDQKQNADILPTLKVSDISPEAEKIEFSDQTQVEGVPVYFVEQPTNGLTYLRIKADVKDLPLHLRPLMPLYRSLVNQLGTSKHSHGEFDNLKDLFTVSGISCSKTVSSSLESINQHSEQLLFRVAFLDRNLHNAFDLLTEFFTQLNFKEFEHISFLIQRSVKGRTDNLVNAGVEYGVSLATSSLTPAANSYEKLQTLNHDCSLASQLVSALSMEDILGDVTERLKEIHSYVMHKSLMSMLVHSSDSSLKSDILQRIQMLTNAINLEFPDFSQKPQLLPPEDFSPFVYQAYFTLPMRVNYVVESFIGAHYTNPDYAAMTVLGDMMSLTMLLQEIREKGGAYGAGVQNDPHRGTFSFFSYRDPNNLRTYNAFEKSIQRCLDGDFE